MYLVFGGADSAWGWYGGCRGAGGNIDFTCEGVYVKTSSQLVQRCRGAQVGLI